MAAETTKAITNIVQVSAKDVEANPIFREMYRPYATNNWNTCQ